MNTDSVRLTNYSKYSKSFFKRSSDRIRFVKRVKFGFDEPVFKGKSCNFSQHGILIRSFKAFMPGSLIRLHIFVDTGILDLDAEVRWVNKSKDGTGTFMGLKFAGKAEEVNKIYKQERKILGESVIDH